MPDSPATYTNRPRRFSFLAFFLGVLLGGGIASAVFTFVLIEQQARMHHEVSEAAHRLGLKGIHVAGNLIDIKTEGDASQQSVLDAGKAFVDDLEKHRLLKVYRSTTEEFQKKTPQDMFTAYVEKYPTLRQMQSFSREQKIRTLPKNKGHEYYFTGLEAGGGFFNIALTLTEGDGEWLIDDLQFSRSTKDN